MKFKSVKEYENHFMSQVKKLKAEGVLDEIGKEAVKMVKNTTSTGKGTVEMGDDKPDKFAPLAESTIKIRERKEVPSPKKSFLRFSGKMFDSLTYRIQQNKIVLYFTERGDIARYHEEGTPKMPARPFMNLTSGQINLLQRILMRGLTKILRRG